MGENELKRVIQISVTATCILAILGILISKADPFSFATIRWISGALTWITLFWAFFFRWGWKLRLLKRIFPKPNLNGTWVGTLTSDWKDTKGNTVGPLDFVVVVRQSFLHIHATTFTASFVARTYAESLILDNDRGVKEFVYLYAQDNTTPGEENNREGAAELRIVESDATTLTGRYWSNAKTNGRVEVERVSLQHAEDFQSAMAMRRG
ncbi:hypothetical protein H6F86_31230 [Phormidium sp. FACHB-592]|uniref:CD-NTase-associated protein 15 domain-containing protein n=1 Tax=Stenomitos frigidus AS-A4 TaxID=2933935 RepID=A0ABV0KU86_9CYAN|nr:hypothetical protein [Phormidium sp. FACHB-592]MBD2078283.1 hypothetical protein [Phormidium sp. FACHB-592]